MKFFSAVFALFIMLGWHAEAQIYDTNDEIVQTFVGYGIPGDVDGQGQFTAFNNPSQIVSDTSSNLYVLDAGNSRIRKITPDGTVTTFVGGGTYYSGYGTNVSLAWGSPGTMVIDHANNLWLILGAYYNSSFFVLTIGTNGLVSFANAGLTNMSASSGMCFDSANNLYYSGGNQIYRYVPGSGMVTVIAGSGISGNYDGPGQYFSAFNSPRALACDQGNNIYVWDSGNETIRRIDPSYNVTTVAGNGNYYYQTVDGIGTNATFNNGINSLFTDHQGNVYFVGNTCVRKMNLQTNVVTLAGNFNQGGYANGAGNVALFNNAQGGCFSQGQVFVADAGNNRIRSIAFNPVSQVVPPASLKLNTYPGLQITGAVGRTYQIQSSPNMSVWTPIATVLLTSSPYLWIDQNPVSGNKFYRAVLLP